MRPATLLLLLLSASIAFAVGPPAVADDPEEPLAGLRIAYVHGDDLERTGDWVHFLSDYGATVQQVDVSEILEVNWPLFDVVIIGADTREPDGGGGGGVLELVAAGVSAQDFGVPGTADSDAILNSGLPVVGIAAGGGEFFRDAGLTQIGYGQAVNDGGMTDVLPIADLPFWNAPLANGIMLGEDVSIVTEGNTGGLRIHFDDEDFAGATVFGTDIDATDTHAPLVGIDDLYRLWGFGASPSGMTLTGQRLFINYLLSIVPPPPLDHHAIVPGAARAP